MTRAMPESGRKAANAERAKRAKVALAAWIPPETDGFDADMLDTDILGLMIDLLHFAHASKHKIRPLLDLAITNFELESEVTV